MKSVAIIGAGACGLVLANLLKDDYKVTLFEKNNRLGKKILASGNGKCNFTNMGDYFNKYNNEFALNIVNRFDNKVIREYFSSLGLMYRVDEEKRVYPLSESSVSVLEVLKKGLKGVRILLESKVISIEDNGNRVKVYYNDKNEDFDYVVCASGSDASNLGSDFAYNYLRNYGIEISELRGSLVPVKVKENIKDLSGVRVKCLVSLYEDFENKLNLVYKEAGEVLFKEDALSGIVIYNMSSLINRDYFAKYVLSLDLLNDSFNMISISDYNGVVHPKLVDYLQGKDPRDLRFNVIGLMDKINAQVTSGGVALKEVNDDLSLIKNSHLFVGGELLDCDGMCGGYNLQFAFSCAFLINESIRKKTNE